MPSARTASKAKQTSKNKYSKETYLTWYEQMQLMRKFEEKSGQLYGQQKIKGFEPILLDTKWAKHIKPVMPVASGGLHPGMVEAICEVYGTTDVTIQAGGGVHGHPQKTPGGARAMRNAWWRRRSRRDGRSARCIGIPTGGQSAMPRC